MSALLLIITGVVSPHLLQAAPPAGLCALMGIAGVCLLPIGCCRKWAWLLLPMAWSLWRIDLQLATQIPAESAHTAVELTGFIAGLPVRRQGLVEFLFVPDDMPGTVIPGPLRVRWYHDAPNLRAGERWRLHLRLRPPQGRVNFSGQDRERWYFARGIAGLGTVMKPGGEKLGFSQRADIQRLRQSLGERIREVLAGHSATGLVLALAIADRSGLDGDLWQSVSVTGTGHLLAISGLHIGLAALFGYWLTRLFLGGLPPLHPAWPVHYLAALVSILMALGYALLAGFGTSTQRAVIMLLVVLTAAILRRTFHPLRMYLLALALVLLADPMAPLQAGFWLSFTAVAVLMAVFVPRLDSVGYLRKLLRAQAGIGLVMLPLSMFWFQQASLPGLLVNLVAIPWVSLVTLPLTLLGMVSLAVSEGLADIVLHMAAESAAWITRFIDVSAGLGKAFAWRTHHPGLLATAVAMLGGFVLLLPRGLKARWLALLLYIPVLLPRATEVPPGGIQLEVLDVGQGLAALVSTGDQMLLYDSGPGLPGQWDLLGSVIDPVIANTTPADPDLVIISHGDLDHAGGMAGLRARLDAGRFRANLARPDGQIQPCIQPLKWNWRGWQFSILHPTGFLPYLGNDSSCVLGIRGRNTAILLPGDISASAEHTLVAAGLGSYDILLAPHHGSRTSSSVEFLSRVRPEIVIVSAGSGNRFGFPDEGVMQRYRGLGARAWSTSGCGAIRIRISPDGGIIAESARRVRKATWRWPAAPECP